MRKVILILIVGLYLLPTGMVTAAAQYVSDELIITLRRGEGDQFKILKMLKAGTPLEVLQEGAEGYLFVRTEDGTEGWVKKQFITSETPKPMIIARLEKERDRLREQVNELEGRQTELTTELENAHKGRSEVDAGFADLQRELDKVKKDYADLQAKAANVVELGSERDRLDALNTQLTSEVEQLRKKNENMLYTGAVKWFVAGGGVFLVGMILGKTSRKKKGFS